MIGSKQPKLGVPMNPDSKSESPKSEIRRKRNFDANSESLREQVARISKNEMDANG
jgi:hypothetical protein